MHGQQNVKLVRHLDWWIYSFLLPAVFTTAEDASSSQYEQKRQMFGRSILTNFLRYRVILIFWCHSMWPFNSDFGSAQRISAF
jgi:hypothetical protein